MILGEAIYKLTADRRGLEKDLGETAPKVEGFATRIGATLKTAITDTLGGAVRGGLQAAASAVSGLAQSITGVGAAAAQAAPSNRELFAELLKGPDGIDRARQALDALQADLADTGSPEVIGAINGARGAIEDFLNELDQSTIDGARARAAQEAMIDALTKVEAAATQAAAPMDALAEETQAVGEESAEAAPAVSGLAEETAGLGKNATGASSLLGGLLGGLGSLTALVGAGLLAGLTAVGGAIVGVGVAALGFAQDSAEATAELQTQLGVTREEAERFAGVAEEVWGKGFTGSVVEAGQAVADVQRLLKTGAGDEDILKGATENALKLRDAFGFEVKESINAVDTLMTNFGLSADEAFDFITSGVQRGLDRSGDFLDTIGEYSTQFAAGGATADHFFSLLETGLQGGMLGTDKAADAFKEFRVRIQDGSQLTADSLAMLGINSDDLAKKMASGQVTAAQAFQLVTDRLRETDNTTIQFQAGVGLLGTQFEDLGTEGALALNMINTNLDNVAGATEGLNARYNSLGDVATRLWRGFIVALEPAGTALLDLANQIMPSVESGLKTAGEVIASTVNTGVQWLTNTGLPAMAQGWAMIQPPLNAIIGGLQSLWGLVSDIASGGPGGLVARMGLTEDQRQVLVNLLATFLMLRDKLREFADSAVAYLGEKLGYIQEWVTTNLPLIRQTFETVMEAIRNAVFEKLGAAAQFWTDHGEAIMAVVSNAWLFVQNYIDTSLESILGILKAGMQLINGDWEGAWETLVATALRVWEGIKTGFSLMVDNILLILHTSIPGIEQYWDGSLEGLLTIVQNLGADMLTAGRALVDNIRKGIEEKWGELVTWFDGRLAELRNMLPFSEPRDASSPLRNLPKSGEAITGGLGKGILAGANALAGAMTDTLARAAQAATAPASASPFQSWGERIFGAGGGIVQAVQGGVDAFDTAVEDYIGRGVDLWGNEGWEGFVGYAERIFGVEEGIIAKVREAIPWFVEIVGFLVLEGATALKQEGERLFPPAIHSALTATVNTMMSFQDTFRGGGTSLAAAVGQGLLVEFARWEAAFRERLQKLRDLMPGSEPRDPSSPLRGLYDAGAAIASNMGRGLSDQAAVLRDTLSNALGGVTIQPPQLALGGAGVASGLRSGLDRLAQSASVTNISLSPSNQWSFTGTRLTETRVMEIAAKADRMLFEELTKEAEHT